MDWLIDGFINWSIDWLIDRFIYLLIYWSSDRLTDWLSVWFIIDFLVYCCFDWLSAWLVCSGQTKWSRLNNVRWTLSYTRPYLHMYTEGPLGQVQRCGSGTGVERPARAGHIWDENHTAGRQLCGIYLYRSQRPRALWQMGELCLMCQLCGAVAFTTAVKQSLGLVLAVILTA